MQALADASSIFLHASCENLEKGMRVWNHLPWHLDFILIGGNLTSSHVMRDLDCLGWWLEKALFF